MRGSRKAISVAVAFAIVFTAFASGCSKSSTPRGSNEVISADTPWYSIRKFQITDDTENVDFEDLTYVGAVGDRILFRATGMYMAPEDTDWETASYFDFNFDFLLKYDMEGNLIDKYDIGELFNENSGSDSKQFIDAVSLTGDQVNIYSTNYEGVTEERAKMVMDINDGSVISYSTDTANEMPGAYAMSRYDGGYAVDAYKINDSDVTSFAFRITDPEGLSSTYDMREYFPGLPFHDISNIVYAGDGKFIISAFTGEIDYTATAFRVVYTYYLIDDNSRTCTEYLGDTSVFAKDFDTAKYQENEGSLSINADGIYQLDFDAGEKSEIFSFDWCNINRYDAGNLSIVSYSDDEIILTGSRFMGSTYLARNEIETMVYVLDKQETNPNVGKTVLVASTLDVYNYSLCEAVCTYNETNPDYYIMLDDSYSVFSQPLDYTVEDLDNMLLNTEAELSYQLMVDLMAGDGPDMILDASYFDQLNSPDYLLDLTDYVDTEGLFENVLNASETDGKLYHCPVTFGINGIIVNSDQVGDNQKGFTFSQYEDFVAGPCNGTDPLFMDKTDFFTTCLSAMNDEFVSGGSVNYNKKSFKDLAEYTLNSTMEGGGEFNFANKPLGDAEFVYGMTLSSLIPRYEDELVNKRVLGLPSSDGRGPLVSMRSSVAISSQTQEPDACAAFMNTLLSEEIQNDYGDFTDGTPVRISSYETCAANLIEKYNDNVEYYAANYTPAEISNFGFPERSIDPGVIEIYREMVESCEDTAALDPAVEIIVYEEIQPYFEGQKSLSEVINIINNRVTTYINERGG